VSTPHQRLEQAIAHHQAGRLAEAEAGYRALVAENPRHAFARYHLGNILAAREQFDEAVHHLRQAAKLQPSAAAWCQLGIVVHNIDAVQAAAAFERALAIDPCNAPAHSNLAVVLTDAGKLTRALAHHRAAIESAPGVPMAHSNYALTLMAAGDVDAALAAYQRAIELSPADPEPHGQLLLALNYHPRKSAADVFEAHRDWARRHADPITAAAGRRSFANDRDPDRPLRVGYVSGDFREHAVLHFFEPVLTRHRRGVVEPYCYSTNRAHDADASRLRAAAGSGWRDVAGRSDEQLAELIRADGIDVLVDLSGHTGQNRLMSLARRPAPVQVGWLGYPGYTGMTAIDFWMTDPLCDPPDESSSYPRERVVRLPDTFACYLPPPQAPPVAPQPARSRGHVTFGSFNILAKLNDDVLDAWAAVMHGVDGSRMVLGATALGDPEIQQSVAARFEQRGIARQRLTFHGRLPVAQYLAAHADIDLLLDTFPFTGHTVSLHGLWMGCGLVTLRGDRHVARRGAAVLTLLGLEDWIADSTAQFLEVAKRAAQDLDRLEEVRRSLRDRMSRSPLMQYDRFVENLEDAYRQMWRRWCDA
jgi:predicted O-linked N-acetylglucosamine transferase (SPINDLY family)